MVILLVMVNVFIYTTFVKLFITYNVIPRYTDIKCPYIGIGNFYTCTSLGSHQSHVNFAQTVCRNCTDPVGTKSGRSPVKSDNWLLSCGLVAKNGLNGGRPPSRILGVQWWVLWKAHRTSYLDHSSKLLIVLEKIAFLCTHFGDRQTDRQIDGWTNRQTNRWTVPTHKPKPPSLSRAAI